MQRSINGASDAEPFARTEAGRVYIRAKRRDVTASQLTLLFKLRHASGLQEVLRACFPLIENTWPDELGTTARRNNGCATVRGLSGV